MRGQIYIKHIPQIIKSRKLLLGVLVTLSLLLLVGVAWQPRVSMAKNAVLENEKIIFLPFISGGQGDEPPLPELGDYVVIGWNDLGMHLSLIHI